MTTMQIPSFQYHSDPSDPRSHKRTNFLNYRRQIALEVLVATEEDRQNMITDVVRKDKVVALVEIYFCIFQRKGIANGVEDRGR